MSFGVKKLGVEKEVGNPRLEKETDEMIYYGKGVDNELIL